MFRLLLPLILMLSIQPLVRGQAVGLGRGLTLGKIEAVGKQDWKGAEVIFFSRPFTGCFEAGEPDLVRVQAGEKGRFQAMLLRGRIYDAWAILRSKDGRYFSTGAVSKMVAGKLAQLKANKREQMEVRLRLLGQKRWPDRGPFSVVVRAGNKQGMTLDLVLDDKGEALLPAMPGSSATVLVSAADGQRLLSKKVSLRASSRKGIPKQIKAYREKYAKEAEKRAKKAKEKALEEEKKREEKQREEKLKEEAAGKAANGEAKKGTAPKNSKKARPKKKDKGREARDAEPGDEEEVEKKQVEKKGEKKGEKKAKPVPIPQEPFPEYLEGDLPAPEVELLVLPRVFKARFLVRDDEEESLEGVELRHEFGDARLGKFPVLGKSDKSGRVDLLVPQPFSGYGIPRAKPTLNIVFSGPEVARSQGGWNSYRRGKREPMSNAEVVARESEIRTVDLPQGFAIKGRVFWRKGEPAKDFPVVVGMGALVNYGPNSWGYSSPQSFIIKTDDNGEFSVPGWHQNLYGGSISAWVDGKELARRFSLGMEVPDTLIQPFPALNLWGLPGEMDLGTLDLSEMRVAQVEVRTSRGEQASFAEVATSTSQSMNWSGFDRDPAFFRVADRRGRAVILVPHSQRNLFVRLEGEGYFFGGMQIPEGKITTPLKVFPRLRLFSKVEGRVVDEKGKPIAGARLSIRSTSFSGGGPDVNMIYNINSRLLKGKSDKQGYFSLEFIPHPNLQFGLGVQARIGNKSYQAPEMIQVSTQAQSGLEIELPVTVAVAEKNAKMRAKKNAKTVVQNAGGAVKSAVGEVGAGIGNAFQSFLEQAKALAAEKKAAEKKAAEKKAAEKRATKKAAPKPAKRVETKQVPAKTRVDIKHK